jgi:uncharacterized protein YndB with AHSA1/START domain
MGREQEGSTFGRISSAALDEATGRGWDDWLAVLDDAGALDMDHKALVSHLEQAHPQVRSGWWRQTIAVGYEQARGRRAVGQTADARYQVGVQRSVATPAAVVWDVLAGRPELWLGSGASIVLAEGERYTVPAGNGTPATSGEVRVVKPGDRIRMTWRPEGWATAATLQLTLTTTPTGKTAIGAHLEKLPDAAAREAMREHWRAALERLVAELEG